MGNSGFLIVIHPPIIKNLATICQNFTPPKLPAILWY